MQMNTDNTFQKLPKTLFSKISKLVGIAFTLLSIFILFPLMFFMKSFLSDSYEKYDYEKIKKNGVEKIATVIDIANINNVNINGKNPYRISYQFEENGKQVVDKCKTLDLVNKSGKIEVGSQLTVKYYNLESVPTNIETFSFPFNLFYILPIIFLYLESLFGCYHIR